MPHMNTYGAQMDRKWTRSGPEVDRKWARSGLEVSICPSVCLSIPNTSLTSLTILMRGIYKRRVLAPCNFFSIHWYYVNQFLGKILNSLYSLNQTIPDSSRRKSIIYEQIRILDCSKIHFLLIGPCRPKSIPNPLCKLMILGNYYSKFLVI